LSGCDVNLTAAEFAFKGLRKGLQLAVRENGPIQADCNRLVEETYVEHRAGRKWRRDPSSWEKSKSYLAWSPAA
jgi:hypothetical protein